MATKMEALLLHETSAFSRLHRFGLFPGYTLSVLLGIAPLLHRRRTRRAEWQMKREGLDRLLVPLDPDALPQDAADLMFFYRTVMERSARRALELGSGQSTLFIARAMHDQGFGHLWSLDDDARWLEHTRAMLPAELRPYVTFVHSPSRVTRRHGIPAWQYRAIPDGEWDFVLIDGPALTPEIRLSCDLIELARKLSANGIGMIDHRWRTAVLAREVAGDALWLRYVPSLESFVFGTRKQADTTRSVVPFGRFRSP